MSITLYKFVHPLHGCHHSKNIIMLPWQPIMLPQRPSNKYKFAGLYTHDHRPLDLGIIYLNGCHGNS